LVFFSIGLLGSGLIDLLLKLSTFLKEVIIIRVFHAMAGGHVAANNSQKTSCAGAIHYDVPWWYLVRSIAAKRDSYFMGGGIHGSISEGMPRLFVGV